jgi:hypothetical protein
MRGIKVKVSQLLSMKVIGAVLIAQVAAIAVVVSGFERQAFSSHGELIVASDMATLARMSDVIVLGTVTAKGGTRDLARDPKNPSRPDPNRTVTAQDYVVSVDSTIKGRVDREITVTSARSGVVRHNGRTGEFDYENFVPLAVGSRYALLLRSSSNIPGVYIMAFEPSRFELGAEARVLSKWTDAKTLFPDTSAEVFVNRIRAAVLSTP